MKPTQILMTRLSAIGDCMETLPLAMAIKKNMPNAMITWIVDCGVDALLQHHPAIDRVIRLRKGFLSRPAEVWRLRNQLRSIEIDISIDPQGLMKSSLLGWLSGAAMRIGFASGQAREQAWRLYHHAIAPQATHLVDRQLELLKPLGIHSPDVEFGWSEPAAIDDEIKNTLRRLQLNVNEYVVVNPGASWASKRWPVDRYRELVKQLHEKTELRSLVVWGNADEELLAKEIVVSIPESACVAPSTSLMNLAGLLRRGCLYIGSDTGPMHMAVAVGTPCVGMFGTSRHEYCGPYGGSDYGSSGQNGSKHRSIQKRYDSGSSKYRRHTTNAAMLEIQVADTLSACLECLHLHSHARPYQRDALPIPTRRAAHTNATPRPY